MAGTFLDEIAIERATAGDHSVTLTHEERDQAIRILHTRGHSDREIGDLLNRSGDLIRRDRRRLGLPANPPDHIDWASYGALNPFANHTRTRNRRKRSAAA